MKRLTEHLNRGLSSLWGLWTQEKGATATEYSILVGFFAIVLFAGVSLFGISLNGVYTGLTTGVQTALGIP
jgi:pilus assembly protein Flp/PilA